MDKIETYNSIDDFNKAFGIETLHPLVNIAEWQRQNVWR